MNFKLFSVFIVVLCLGMTFASVVPAEEAEPESYASCAAIGGPSECGPYCSQRGFSNGRCLNGQCVCTMSDAEETNPEAYVSCASVGGPAACRPHCILNGHNSGSCVNGRCQCRFGFNSEEIKPESDATCGPGCRPQCILQGHNSGACRNGHCQCT